MVSEVGAILIVALFARSGYDSSLDGFISFSPPSAAPAPSGARLTRGLHTSTASESARAKTQVRGHAGGERLFSWLDSPWVIR